MAPIYDGTEEEQESVGNSDQTLCVLLLLIRHTIDTILNAHRDGAINAPGGDVFEKLLQDVDPTPINVAEYCLFVLRTDKPNDVIKSFHSVMGGISRVFNKFISSRELE